MYVHVYEIIFSYFSMDQVLSSLLQWQNLKLLKISGKTKIRLAIYLFQWTELESWKSCIIIGRSIDFMSGDRRSFSENCPSYCWLTDLMFWSTNHPKAILKPRLFNFQVTFNLLFLWCTVHPRPSGRPNNFICSTRVGW